MIYSTISGKEITPLASQNTAVYFVANFNPFRYNDAKSGHQYPKGNNMGRKSIKINKNIYQRSREMAGLTREGAASLLDCISADRIEKIESEKSLPHPDEILAMSIAYKAPVLCNHYCAHECQLGQRCIPPVEMKELSVIILEILASLNTLSKDKDRLIEIAADSQLTCDEIADFIQIRKKLCTLSQSIAALNLWVDYSTAHGLTDAALLSHSR